MKRPDLDPASPAGEASRLVCHWLLSTMVANERGVRDNLDPDYLHDFRVAARRTRSLLAQMKRVFPPGEAERYRCEFSWLGSRSGATRDLDVMLLKMPSYVDALSRAMQSDVSVLVDILKRWQREEHALFVRALDSERYSLLVRQWGAFLETPLHPVEGTAGKDHAARPIIQVASRRIRKAHRKVLKKGQSIDAEATPKALHQMRIPLRPGREPPFVPAAAARRSR